MKLAYDLLFNLLEKEGDFGKGLMDMYKVNKAKIGQAMCNKRGIEPPTNRGRGAASVSAVRGRNNVDYGKRKKERKVGA